MPNTIKVKRGKSAALNSSTEKLQAGEVLYNLDKNYLTVGAKDNDALTKKPVAAREIVGYVGDTDSKVGASTTEAYSIRYNDDSGVVVSSENNILSTPGTLKMQTPGKNASTITINTGEVDSDGSAKPTIELSTSLSMPVTLALPWKTGTLATTDDITTSITTKLDNTNEDKVALKNNKSLSYTSEATANTIISRDANGAAEIETGSTDKSIINKGFADSKYSQATNIDNGNGDNSLQQIADPKKNGKLKFPESSLYAKVLDPTLTLDSEPIGGQADFSVSLGGNSSAQAKRAIAGGTTTVARGPYSTVFGDNCVTLAAGSDSLAHGYQTVTDAPASHTEGSYTVVMNQKYVEGMFDPSTEPGQPGQPTEPSETPTDTLSMDTRRGEAGHASGFNSYVSGFAGYTDGVSNVADGHISKASGRSNRAWSYLSKVDGYQSVVKPNASDKDASGEGSWANGYDVQIDGAKYAYAGGQHIRVGKDAHNSFSYGYNLVAEANSQAVFGKYNIADDISLFMIGAGADEAHRKTIMRALNNGQVLFSEAPTNPEAPIRLKDFTDDYYPASKAEIAKLALKANDFTEEGTIKAVLDNKIEKHTTGNIVYGTNVDGEQTILKYANDITANALVQRDVQGEIKTSILSTSYNTSAVPNTAYLYKYYNSFGGIVDLPSISLHADLNSYKEVGSYYISTNAVQTIKNLPEQTGGRLDILNAGQSNGSTNNTIQIYRTMYSKTNNWYFRSLYYASGNAKWTAWKQVASMADVGEFITPSTATNDATSGTFTADEWSKLQTNMNNKILFNNEIYRLNDPSHTAGTWSYIHAGWDGTDVMDKSINVTVATGAWTLVTGEKKVNISDNFVKVFTIPNGASSGTLTADVKQKLCNPDGHNYYVYDTTSEMILKYSFNEDDEIIQYRAVYIQSPDKVYDITMQIFPSNGKWTRSQTILKGVTANPTLTGTEDELTGLKIGGTDYKISVTKEYVDDGFVRKVTGSNQVYSKGSDGVDGSIGYSQSPVNSAIVQYTSAGTVRTNDPVNNLDAVNKLYLESNAPSLKSYYSIIPSDGNANSYTSAGTYVCDAYSTTLVNFPAEFNAGRLYVLYGTQASEYPIQIVFPYNSSSIYIRNQFENNWSAWSKLATISDINNKKVFSVTIYEAGD